MSTPHIYYILTNKKNKFYALMQMNAFPNVLLKILILEV